MKTSSHYGRMLLFTGALCAALEAPAAPGAEETNAPVYQVVIDGKAHVLKGGRTERITLSDGKEIRIAVNLNRVQPYRTAEFEFEYDAGLSLKDDQDASERIITLLHARGCGLVITDQGPAKDINPRKLLLGLMDQMLHRAKRGVAKNISKATIEQVSFPHAKGVTTKSTHVDEDGDTQTNILFTADAVVSDEEHEYRGAAIKGWIDKAIAQYKPRAEVISLTPEGDKTVVTAQVSGTFPGSPVQLRYRFTLRSDKIAALAIGA